MANVFYLGMWWALAGGVVIEAIAFSVLVITTNWELEAEQVSIHSLHLLQL